MQQNLKKLEKSFFLFALSCVLLSLALAGSLQHASTASAATLHTANVPPRTGISPICQVCNLTYDIYTTRGDEVWGYAGILTALIDDNQIGMTNGSLVSGQFGNIVRVFARGDDLYEVRQISVTQNFILKVVLGGCSNTATGYCLTELDDSLTAQVATGGNGLLYQIRANGTVWQSTSACFQCWILIDSNNASLIVAATHLYELRSNSTVWRYNGCGNSTCWTEIDSNSTIDDLVVSTTGVLYELRSVFSGGTLASSNVLEGIGPFNFQSLDTVDLTDSILASTRLYQVDQINNTNDSPQSLLLYTGGNPAWKDLAATIGLLEPGAGTDAVYDELSNGSLWEFTPEAGWAEIQGPSSGGDLSRPSGAVLFTL